MDKVKRFTACLLGHKWTKVAYPPSPEGEATGTFLRCLRCGAGGPRGGHSFPAARWRGREF